MTNRTDNFNRANSSTSLGSPSDSGAAWTQYVGTMGIAGNQAYDPSGTDSNAIAALESSVADADVQVTHAVDTTSAHQGCVARLADANNCLAWLNISNAGALRMYKKVGGSFTQLGSDVSYSPANGNVLKFSVKGSTLVGYLNGTSKLTVTDSTGSTNTQHGILLDADSTARMDDFSITANNVSASAKQLAALGCG